jgi:predicted nucleic acid-binding protein
MKTIGYKKNERPRIYSMVLDTNAYTALAVGNPQIIDAVKGVLEIKLPLPVIAELRYGFINGNQPERNEQLLQRFLAQSNVIILMPSLKTTIYYSKIQLFCKRYGKALSHNDIWIAALAYEAKDTLITFDKDFTILKEDFLADRIIIL